MIVLLSIVLLSVVIVSGICHRYCRSGRLMAKIPGPARLPLIGNMFDMRQSPENLFKSLRQWHKTYGRIYQLSGAHIRTIHLFYPEDLEVILSSTRHIEKQLPYTFLYSWLGHGLLVSNGDRWHQRRKMLTPAFHLNILKKFIKVFNEQTENFLNNLENEVGNEGINVIPPITKVALRIMCETSIGTKIHEDTPIVQNYLKAVHKIGVCIVQRLSTPWYFVNLSYNLSSLSRKEKSILPDLHRFTNELILQRREYRRRHKTVFFKNEQRDGEKSRPSMLDLLLDEEEQRRIDEAGIREEVDTFLFEGHDTTATALIFLIFRIANEQEIQNNIYAEMESIFGDSKRQPTLEDLNKMKYLECCIKESLRLYPSVPFISRFLTEELVVAGHTVPKNTFCDIHIFDVHRNPDIYPDPERFIPERFLPENMNKLHPYAYIHTVQCGLQELYRSKIRVVGDENSDMWTSAKI